MFQRQIMSIHILHPQCVNIQTTNTRPTNTLEHAPTDSELIQPELFLLKRNCINQNLYLSFILQNAKCPIS